MGRVQITAADRAGIDAHEHFPLAERRDRHITQLQRATGPGQQGDTRRRRH
jgi:hypothetical protein